MIPEGWRETALGAVSSRVRRPLTAEPDRVMMITSRGGFVDQSEKYSKEMAGKSLAKYIELRLGEFAYNRGNSTAYPCGCIYRLKSVDAAAVPFVYFCFSVDESEAAPDFLEQYFAAGTLNEQLGALINSGVRNNGLLNIPADAFFSVNVLLPPLGEQRKIAAILTAVDEAIEATQAVIEQLQVVKKAMMAELLTRGIPGRHTRFKMTEIGEIPESWEVVQLGDVASADPYSCVGGPFGSDLSSKHYVSSGVPVIRGSNLGASERWMSELEFVFVTESKATELSRNLAFPGDIVFTQRGTMGQVARIDPGSQYPRFLLSQSQMKFTADSRRLEPDFVACFFRSNIGQAMITKETIGTGVPHINLGILRQFRLALPPMPEQKEIVDAVGRLEKREWAEQSVLSGLAELKSSLAVAMLSGELRVFDSEVSPP